MNQGGIENVIVSRSVMKIIEKFKQNSKKAKESGGILLAQVKEKNVYIIKVTTPNRFDKATRYSFHCDKDAAQLIIDYEFINSGQKTIYIGEWHTHPENYPNPSRVDKNMIVGQYFKNKLNESFLILIIQGLKGIYVAIFDGKILKETKLFIIEDN